MAGGNGRGRDDAFFTAVLQKLNAPVTPANLSVLRAWQRMESGTPQQKADTASWNPFSTTLNVKGATSYNGAGVKNYANMAQGVDATVQTLTKSNAAYGYGAIVKALRQGNSESALQAIVASSWNAPNHYGATKRQGQGWTYKSTTIYKLWQSLVGSAQPTVQNDGEGLWTAITNADRPAQAGPSGPVASGDGTYGVGKYDPLKNLVVIQWNNEASAGKLHPENSHLNQITMQKYLASYDWETRSHIKMTIGTIGSSDIYNAVDPGVVREITPFTDTEGNPLPGTQQFADSLVSVGSFFDWANLNKGRVGLAVLAGFLVIMGIALTQRGKIAAAVGTATNVIPQGKLVKAAAKVGSHG